MRCAWSGSTRGDPVPFLRGEECYDLLRYCGLIARLSCQVARSLLSAVGVA